MLISTLWLSITAATNAKNNIEVYICIVVLTKNLSQNKEKSDAELDNLWSIVEELQKVLFNKDEHCSALIHIHTCAVTLWNLTVGMKIEGSANLTFNAKRKLYLPQYDSFATKVLLFMYFYLLFSTVRHASCNLVCIANTAECTETSYKNQLIVSILFNI